MEDMSLSAHYSWEGYNFFFIKNKNNIYQMLIGCRFFGNANSIRRAEMLARIEAKRFAKEQGYPNPDKIKINETADFTKNIIAFSRSIQKGK